MHINKHWLAGLVLALGVAAGAGALTDATDAGEKVKGGDKGKGNKVKVETIDPIGEPKQFHKGELTGFAVWHGKHHDGHHGWHLRTTTKKEKHHFKGHIHVSGGTFEHVGGYHLEHKGPLEDHWKVSEKKHEITFDFHTNKHVDGIHFRVTKEAKSIRFHLHFNGKEQKEHILIGHEGHHPMHNPFALVAHGHGKK